MSGRLLQYFQVQERRQSDVAFTVVIRKDVEGEEGEEERVPVLTEAVSEAVNVAVQDVRGPLCGVLGTGKTIYFCRRLECLTAALFGLGSPGNVYNGQGPNALLRPSLHSIKKHIETRSISPLLRSTLANGKLLYCRRAGRW